MKILQDISLKKHNTFGIDVLAEYFVEINHVSNIDVLRKNTIFKKNKLILGGGSNILFTKNYNGLVIKNNIRGKGIIKETETEIYIKVNAGENWHEFVLLCVENNWAGIENLSLIPGNVGTSPIQNIGAYGVELKDVFYSLEAYNIKTAQIETFYHSDCNFGYRESVFKKELKEKYIIASVVFKLAKNSEINISYGAIEKVLIDKKIISPTIKDVSKAIIEIRESKLPNPNKIGNAGSFFKNPIISRNHLSALQKKHPNIVFYKISEDEIKIPAGWLIDNADWKGKTFEKNSSKFGVHKNQALVLVNYKNTKGKYIYALAKKIQKDIFEKYEIDLEMEVNIN